MKNQAPLFTAPDAFLFPEKQFFLKKIIEDKWSSYSATGDILTPDKDPQKKAKLYSYNLKKGNNYYKKATHNSYARRCERNDGLVIEWYTDDGEKWAGLCILREMRKEKILNGIIIITRYYWWVKLGNDRFKHVVSATQKIIKEIKSDRNKENS